MMASRIHSMAASEVKQGACCDKIILSVSQFITQLGVSMENAKKQALRRLHLALSIDAPSCDTDTRLWCLLFVTRFVI